MQRTFMETESTYPIHTQSSALSSLLSNSDDDFYGSLQRIWNSVVQLEDLGMIHSENDKFVYAYRFAEAELHRAYSEKESIGITSSYR